VAPFHFPAGQTVNHTHSGRADQGLAYIAWPTAGFYRDERRTRGMNLLAQVFQLRLNEEIRERQGAAYSPNASHNASEAVPDYGVFAAYIETPPAGLEGFMRDAMAIARSLRETPIAADELQRARRPFLETLQRTRNSSNAWWLNNLAGVQQHPERAESLRISQQQYEAITPAELQALARQYLADERAFRLFIRPRG
jgi:zinc protease